MIFLALGLLFLAILQYMQTLEFEKKFKELESKIKGEYKND